MNPGFAAFQKLKNHISNKLKLPPIQAATLASKVKNEYKEKFPDLNSVELTEKSINYFDQNINKFEKMV